MRLNFIAGSGLPEKSKKRKITVSAPGKIHLIGEHFVVYGKPAILSSIDKRVKVIISQGKIIPQEFKKIQILIDKIVQKHLKLKRIPQYNLQIVSEIPLGSGLGSSAAICSAYITALLTYLRVSWDLNLINKLTFEAEKVFQGNPSGADQSAVIFGGLIWFRKDSEDLKLMSPIPFSIPNKLSKNFLLINTGRPLESTAQMVEQVKFFSDQKPKLFEKILNSQEQLTQKLLSAIKASDEKEFMKIISQTEQNLEKIGVVSKSTKEIIRQIESLDGVAKISGAGGKIETSGILVAYHPTLNKLIKFLTENKLEFFKTKLAVEGLRIEK